MGNSVNCLTVTWWSTINMNGYNKHMMHIITILKMLGLVKHCGCGDHSCN
jgi:hypothetical protein